LPEASQRTLIEVLATRRGPQAMPWVLSLVRSDKPEQRLAGLRCLGNIGDASAIPLLLETLSAGGELTVAAQQALAALPRKEAGLALLEALQGRTEIRPAVIEVLKTLRYYEAIDPLIELAAQPDPAVYGPALDGLRGIADPDEHDIPRLVQLLRKTPRGEQRDEVEKTLLIVCEKSPPGADRAEPVWTALAKAKAPDAPEFLPLLGRLGGPRALAGIEAGLADPRPEIQEAAVRGLCNWPTAEVADRLWGLAGESDNANFRRWALRAYVRVVSLKSERPDDQTLAMLQNAMKLCRQAEDEQLILERASAIRTLDSVLWIATYLDDPQRNQAACRALVELAHHRFLRQPNLDRFGPILDKVSAISQDPEVVERAKRYRLGL
jgi:HEAT repeat protein